MRRAIASDPALPRGHSVPIRLAFIRPALLDCRLALKQGQDRVLTGSPQIARISNPIWPARSGRRINESASSRTPSRSHHNTPSRVAPRFRSFALLGFWRYVNGHAPGFPAGLSYVSDRSESLDNTDRHFATGATTEIPERELSPRCPAFRAHDTSVFQNTPVAPLRCSTQSSNLPRPELCHRR